MRRALTAFFALFVASAAWFAAPMTVSADEPAEPSGGLLSDAGQASAGVFTEPVASLGGALPAAQVTERTPASPEPAPNLTPMREGPLEPMLESVEPAWVSVVDAISPILTPVLEGPEPVTQPVLDTASGMANDATTTVNETAGESLAPLGGALGNVGQPDMPVEPPAAPLPDLGEPGGSSAPGFPGEGPQPELPPTAGQTATTPSKSLPAHTSPTFASPAPAVPLGPVPGSWWEGGPSPELPFPARPALPQLSGGEPGGPHPVTRPATLQTRPAADRSWRPSVNLHAAGAAQVRHHAPAIAFSMPASQGSASGFGGFAASGAAILVAICALGAAALLATRTYDCRECVALWSPAPAVPPG